MCIYVVILLIHSKMYVYMVARQAESLHTQKGGAYPATA